MSAHLCKTTNDNKWAHCNVCGGRIHLNECTSRRRPSIDCPGQEFHTAEEMVEAYGGTIEEYIRAGHPYEPGEEGDYGHRRI